MNILDPQEVQGLYVSYKNIHEMLRDRHYEMEEDTTKLTLDDFCARFGTYPNRKQMLIVCHHPDKSVGTMIVVFAVDPKVGVGTIKDLISLMHDQEATNAILVVHVGLTPSAAAALRQVKLPLQIQVFKEQELVVMPSCIHHELQPRFEILTADQKESMLKFYQCKEIHLPIMLQTDLICRYYGLKKGTIVKIIRPSETAGEYILFRCVR